jgi:AcrR family transcriptional regulator
MTARQRNARGQGARLREDLLLGAQRILEQTGSEDAVTLRAVAREVGVSAPSIYTHFADGRAIVDAVIEQAFTELVDVLRHTGDQADGADRLFALCVAYVRFGLERPGRYLTLFQRRRGLERTQRLEAEAAMYDKGAEAFAILVQAIDEMYDGEADFAREDATLLWMGLHGYVSLRASTPGFAWFADEEGICRQLVDRVSVHAGSRRS